jgi:hypothetical protein
VEGAKYAAAAAISVGAGYLVYRFVAKKAYTPTTFAIDAAIGLVSFWALSKGGWLQAVKGAAV